MGWFDNILSKKDKAEFQIGSPQRKGNTANKVTYDVPKQKGIGTDNTLKTGVSGNDTETKGTILNDSHLAKYPGIQLVWKGNRAWDNNSKEEAARLYEQALADGYFNGAGDKPFFNLGRYYMERKDWKNLKRILKVSPEFMRKQRWHVEGVRLVEANLGKMPNGWIDIGIGKTANENGGETWLKKYERLTETLPVFDFDVADNESKIRGEDVTALREFDLSLKRRLNEARDCEAKNDYRQAAEIYAEFVRNGYWKTEPYTRLMEIYRMAGLDDERRRLMKHAVDHFSQQRFWMRDRVIRLSYIYDCNAFVEKTINEGKRIPYYDGLFDVYSPYPEIEEWQKQLGD